MKLKLNGWQRLWVVAAGIYFVVVCGVGAAMFPDGARLEAERAKVAIDLALRAQVDAARTLGNERAELDALRNLKRGAAEIRTEAYGDLSDAELIQRIRTTFGGKADFSTLDERIKRDAERLRDDRTTFIFQAAAWWAIPVLALYILGSAIGWVIRGFRNKGEV